MNILIFDNYDSFTYNLVQLIKEIGYTDLTIARNDQIKLESISDFDKILISPGPGIPSEAGILLEMIKRYASTKSIFGVCLGQQAIAEAFGGTLYNLPEVYHGVSSPITITKNDCIFEGLPTQFNVGRYHSWVVNKSTIPEQLEITAVDKMENIMALRHRELDVRGVQFHPESILTEHGKSIIEKWLKN